ncbi:MAG: hypothetical protein WDZ80_05375 [Candidatus Paceibacterota bacterium]
MNSAEYLAKILGTDKDDLIKIENRLESVTGKKNVMEKIIADNTKEVKKRLEILGLKETSSAKEVYDALIFKIEKDAKDISEALDNPKYENQEDTNRLLKLAKDIVSTKKGFFLKKEKAKEFLVKEPPENVMNYLGYDSVEKMLDKEDLLEVYSSLRFLEDRNWMNNVFFKQYEVLTPDDFEEREIEAKALDKKWVKAAESFVSKKWHNISHLKEMGVVFVIPITLGIPGEMLRMLSLVLHYLYEVPFYSDMFKKCLESPALFDEKVISLLRGDVYDKKLSEGEKSIWLVVQRYLAKDDENDWRLSVPRINPEAYHWARAEKSLVKLGNSIDHLGPDLSFWCDLDWVGDYFKDELGNDSLVSFDLVDTVMSLVQSKDMIKYLYHHRESLWNKIFIEYFGEDQLEYFLKEHLLQGYFEI